jgi:hypothetical protein
MISRKHAFLEIVKALEEEFRIRFPEAPTASAQSVTDRVRRSLSWLRRAGEVSDEDLPPRFADLWIALNALYGQSPYMKEFLSGDREDFREFVQRLTKLRVGRMCLNDLLSKRHFYMRSLQLIENKHLWNEWWSAESTKYRVISGKELVRFEKSVRIGDTATVLRCLFERLQILRNQIFHGSSSASTRKSRDALYPAILILEEMLPEIIRLLIREGPWTDWPPVPYPGKGTPQYPESH